MSYKIPTQKIYEQAHYELTPQGLPPPKRMFNKQTRTRLGR